MPPGIVSESWTIWLSEGHSEIVAFMTQQAMTSFLLQVRVYDTNDYMKYRACSGLLRQIIELQLLKW